MSFVGKTGQGTSGFSPTSIPDCVLWLDAADSNVITLSGSNVTQWNDKSGRGFNFTKNASYPAPVYQTNGINGRPALQFSNDGNLGTTNTRFLENSSVSFDNTSYSIFAVANLTAVNSWTNAQYILKGEITGDNYLFFGSRAGNIATFTGPAGSWNDTNANSPTTTILNTPRIVAMTVSNAVMVPFYDGIAMSTKTGTTGSFSGLRLGETAPLGNSGQGWTGFISEVLVYSRAIPADQRQQVEGYLTRKWGLGSNLPATQPFRSLPPVMRPFQPIDISGCALWLDGADSNAMTFSGSAITRWLDKSGSGRHADTCGNGTVTWGTTSTGYRAPTLAGSNYFSLSNATTLSSTSASYFVQAFATSNNRTAVAFWANSRIIGPTYYWNVGANLSYSPYTWQNSNALISVVENSASNTTLHFNGNSVGTLGYRARSDEGYALSASNRVVVGAHWSLDNLWIGNIQEVIFYDGALTPGQRQQVETYLTNKWATRGFTPSNHYARLAPALSLSFVPTSVETCSLWLDAADPSTFTLSGSSVSQWSDKSGNARHATQATSANRPTRSGNSVVFAGTSGTPQFFNMTDAFNMFSATGRFYHIFIVERRTTSNISFILGGSDTGPNVLIVGYTGSTEFRITTASVADTNLAVPAFQTPEPTRLWGTVYNGTTRNLFLNGTLGTSTAFTQAQGAWTNPYLGWISSYGLNTAHNGIIYEILVYGSPLTVSQRQIIEGYLANKWGLANSLPNGHPFKTVKP